MPRGKPFVCWISNPGRYHDVALHIGDQVEIEISKGQWVQGKFGCSRKKKIFPYFVQCGKIRHQAGLRHKLRPVQAKVNNGSNDN